MNHKPAVVAKLLKPAGDVRGLIVDYRRRNSGFGAKVGASHFRDQFLFGIDGGTERSDFRKCLLAQGAFS